MKRVRVRASARSWTAEELEDLDELRQLQELDHRVRCDRAAAKLQHVQRAKVARELRELSRWALRHRSAEMLQALSRGRSCRRGMAVAVRSAELQQQVAARQIQAAARAYVSQRAQRLRLIAPTRAPMRRVRVVRPYRQASTDDWDEIVSSDQLVVGGEQDDAALSDCDVF